MTRRELDPEQYAVVDAKVRELIALLRDLTRGLIDRKVVGEWTRKQCEKYFENPFTRHGTANTVVGSLYHLDQDTVVRDHELRTYLRWLTEGEAFRGDEAPFAMLPGRLADWLDGRHGEPAVRFVIEGLGWFEGAQVGSPATGRAFTLWAPLNDQNNPPSVSVVKQISDDFDAAVRDLFEMFAIDERDLLHLDARANTSTLVEWELWRLDDNGNEQRMETFRSRAKAVAAQQGYEARGHRQSYFVRRA